MMAAILNSAMLDSDTLVFSLKITHTSQDWFPPFAQINFTHSFWLNLMMAAFLNSAKLDSDSLFSSLRFTQKYCHSTLNLTQTHSFSPNFLIAAILNCAILDSAIFHKKPWLIHSHSTWWWWISWILPSWILPSWIQLLPHWFPDTLFTSLRFTQKHS